MTKSLQTIARRTLARIRGKGTSDGRLRGLMASEVNEEKIRGFIRDFVELDGLSDAELRLLSIEAEGEDPDNVDVKAEVGAKSRSVLEEEVRDEVASIAFDAEVHRMNNWHDDEPDEPYGGAP